MFSKRRAQSADRRGMPVVHTALPAPKQMLDKPQDWLSKHVGSRLRKSRSQTFRVIVPPNLPLEQANRMAGLNGEPLVPRDLPVPPPEPSQLERLDMRREPRNAGVQTDEPLPVSDSHRKKDEADGSRQSVLLPPTPNMYPPPLRIRTTVTPQRQVCASNQTSTCSSECDSASKYSQRTSMSSVDSVSPEDFPSPLSKKGRPPQWVEEKIPVHLSPKTCQKTLISTSAVNEISPVMSLWSPISHWSVEGFGRPTKHQRSSTAPTLPKQSPKREFGRLISDSTRRDMHVRILAHMGSLDDLFNMAVTNRTMYQAYLENALMLVHSATFNESPAAWEFHEWSRPPASRSPRRYVRCHRRDLGTINALRRLILQHYSHLLRPGSAQAFYEQRFTDAFWRIWTFCSVFGAAKDREDDVTGQLDWLHGGTVAKGEDMSATVNPNLDFDICSILLNVPYYYARGQPGGLNQQQLADMMEVWKCLRALLRGYRGQIDQARAVGVFTDTEGYEPWALEEWLCYLTTLGLGVILELATVLHGASRQFDGVAAGFGLAQERGWTKWSKPQHRRSRRFFLREPVARLYNQLKGEVYLSNGTERSQRQIARLSADMRRCRDINPDQHHRIPPFAVQRTIDESKPDSPSIEFKPGRRPNPSPAVTTPRPPSRPPPAPPATIPPPPTIRIEHSPIRIEYAPLRIEHSEIKIDHGPRIPIHAVGRMQRESDSAMIRQKTECEIVRHIAGMGFPGPMVREVLRKTGTNNIHQVELAVDVLLQK